MNLPCPETCPNPACRSMQTEVQETCLLKAGMRYRRRRCKTCGRRWSTYESVLNPRKLRVLRRNPSDNPHQ